MIREFKRNAIKKGLQAYSGNKEGFPLYVEIDMITGEIIKLRTSDNALSTWALQQGLTEE